ncbi:MAG: hypothetical protein ACWGQW_01115 [bacterium]
MNTCIIIGNGPSLRQVPTKFLDSYPTFGTNRIYLRYTPTYYVCINPLVLEQFHPEIAQVQSKEKFIRSDFAGLIPGSVPLHTFSMPTFARTPLNGLYEGFTVTYVAMQLAYFKKFDTILLVGVDHRFEFEGKPNEERVLDGNDPNHFDPNYFKGVRWNNPDLKQSEKSYRMAKVVFEADNRRIINLGPDSDLEIFERGNIKDW